MSPTSKVESPKLLLSREGREIPRRFKKNNPSFTSRSSRDNSVFNFLLLNHTPRMGQKIRVAVLGVGSLGQHHARLYSELAAAGSVEFTGVFDAHTETARKIAAKHNLRVFNSVADAAA